MSQEFERTLEDIDRRCQSDGFPYAVIGGIAAIIHGSTRTTADIDLSILSEIDQLETVLTMFGADYFSLQPDPLIFFQRCLFVPLQNRVTKVRVDIAAALSNFERRLIERSQRLKYNEVEVNVSTIEDLILLKLVAARPKDVQDLQTYIPLNRKTLDIPYLRAKASEFIEVERSDVPEQLEKLLQSLK